MLTSILLIHLRTMPPSYKIAGNCIFFSKIKGDNYKGECHVYSIRTDKMTTVRVAGCKHTSFNKNIDIKFNVHDPFL